MSIISPSSIDLDYNLLSTTCKGFYNDNNRVYLKLMKVNVMFAGDNKKFESDPSKVKKYIKFVPSVAADYKLLHSMSDFNSSKNKWIDDTNIATAYINDYTKFFDKDNHEITNLRLMDLKDAVVDVILGGTVFKNKFGTFERLTVRQLRVVEKVDRQSMFDSCLF